MRRSQLYARFEGTFEVSLEVGVGLRLGFCGLRWSPAVPSLSVGVGLESGLESVQMLGLGVVTWFVRGVKLKVSARVFTEGFPGPHCSRSHKAALGVSP